MRLKVDSSDPVTVSTYINSEIDLVPTFLCEQELVFGDHTITVQATGAAVGLSYLIYYGLPIQHIRHYGWGMKHAGSWTFDGFSEVLPFQSKKK